jgi:hypothetical protein
MISGRRVDEITVDRILNEQLRLAVIHRHRPEGVHRRELSGGEGQRVVVLATIECLTGRVDAENCRQGMVTFTSD